MAFKELQKLAFVLSGCFSVLLVASAFAASLFFNWNTPRVRPCGPEAAAAPVQVAQARAEGELPALDPEQEDLLNSDAVLAPTEVLGLNEDLDLLGNVGKKTEAPTRSKLAAKVDSQPDSNSKDRAPASPVPPTQASLAVLEAPANARPNHRANLAKSGVLRLHWDTVRGATDYHVRVWTTHSGLTEVLADQNTTATELRLDPKATSTLSWQVTARDNSGNAGKPAGPLNVELLTRRPIKNR